MKKEFIILAIFLNISLISALQVEISIKDSFSVGENVTFNYTFIPDETKRIDYYVGAECSNEIGFPSFFQISLTSGERTTKEYSGFEIKDGIVYEDCTAFVIWEGNIANQTFMKIFEVEDNPPADDGTPNDGSPSQGNDESTNPETSNEELTENGNEIGSSGEEIVDGTNPAGIGASQFSGMFKKIFWWVVIGIGIIIAIVFSLWILNKTRERAAENISIETNN